MLVLDGLKTLYDKVGFQFIDITSNVTPIATRRACFESMAQLYMEKFPEHERIAVDDLRQIIENPDINPNYKMLVLARKNHDNSYETGALAMLEINPESGCCMLDYLAKNDAITIGSTQQNHTVAGSYMLRKAEELARANHCKQILIECELPSVPKRFGTLITMDPVKRIQWYLNQDSAVVPINYSKVMNGNVPYLALLAKPLNHDQSVDYGAIATCMKHATSRRSPEMHHEMMEQLTALNKNPAKHPMLSEEMEEVCRIRATAIPNIVHPQRKLHEWQQNDRCQGKGLRA